MLTMIFLARTDKTRYGKLVEGLNNSYLAKKDNYPTLVDDALTLLSHYQDHQGRAVAVNDNAESETIFAQFKHSQQKGVPLSRLARICCFRCNELGHVQTECPLNNGRPCSRNHNHLQQGHESDDEAGSVARSMGSASRPRRSGWAG